MSDVVSGKKVKVRRAPRMTNGDILPGPALEVSRGRALRHCHLTMEESVYSSYPPELSPAQQNYLVTAVKDWAIQNGLAVRPGPAILSEGIDPNGVLATNAPVTLFPSPFPRACFEDATALQTVYNELYAAITCNEQWLGKIVEE